MSLIDGKGLIVWEGGLFDPANADSMDLLARLKWAFTKLRAEGVRISLTEAGRPFGVFSDRYVEDASETASGMSTVHFQWGRYLRGETPSAANPANGELASDHTKGIASDTNCNNMARRREVFAEVGMRFNVPSESWHSIKEGTSPIDLSDFAYTGFTPIETPEQREERELMSALEEIKQLIAASEKRVLERTGRGGLAVYWHSGWGRTYSVSPGLIHHHSDVVQRDLGYQQAGQLEELAIPTDDFNIIRLFSNNGIDLSLDQIRKAPAGTTFTPGMKVTW